ncbi:hypothetical protein C2857_001197 [Epichloe festucae Fl1]|uniref:O-methylsterigmatocystin oxidoreductase n=1 Tax=Epichloe festucae (strain Fl1) TaxID=877507 RepID=A0A7S9KRG6_EPIFF|nr:hypothetical protein C2857_001197 [Epichloe festucae Fl1]
MADISFIQLLLPIVLHRHWGSLRNQLVKIPTLPLTVSIMTNSALILGILAPITLLVYYVGFRKSQKLPLPPGPKPLPVVGNIRDLPPSGKPEFQHWSKFKDLYGPVSSVSVLGATIILLQDRQSSQEILEKNSMKTYGRPSLLFANEFCGFDKFLATRPYDAKYRRQRKLIHQQLGTKAVASKFHNVQDVESRRFLMHILEDPDRLVEHIKLEASAIILKIVYGYSVEQQTTDPLVNLIERMMANFSIAMLPMTWAVDMIPFLRYLPTWFPGTSFHETGQQWKAITERAMNTPYSFVRDKMKTRSNRPSFVASLVQKHSQGADGDEALNKLDEDDIKQAAGTMYGGGADTTVSSIMSFVLAMMVFPEVQRKAQEEIDNVLGSIRFPQYTDRARLPYVNALLWETQRWMPVVPICSAHVAGEDIEYEGLRIPKGAYILSDTWAVLHDPLTYADPFEFDPQRYLEPRNEPDPTGEAFGYGRRVCPGRHFADDSLFLTISRLLATFDIKVPVDAQGNKVEVKVEATPGLITHPAEYPYDIRPRSENHANLIRSVKFDHAWEGSDSCCLGII